MFSGIKELLNNFINPVIDNNVRDNDIPDDNFMRIAMADGMSLEDINLLQRTRNGIEIIDKKSKRIEKNKEENHKESISNENIRANAEIKKDQGREPGE